MTKKDFIAIAEIIRQAKEWESSEAAINDIAEKLALFFKCNNPRFDTQRFLDACGVK